MKLDLKELNKRIELGFIRKQSHPTLELDIYNYTDMCSYEKAWDEYTRMCRGLVLDREGNIIARAFDKFFNLGEADIPNTDPKTLSEIINEYGEYVITEKVDGSLGILFVYADKFIFATRGSFTSEQSIVMKELFEKATASYRVDILRAFQLTEYTHLFEIIYPENRIVVNYGDQRKLVYLGSRNKEDGRMRDISILKDAFESPKIYDSMVDNIPNAEGYVLYFNDGFKLKVKFEEYKRLHRIVTGLNIRSIWEMLSEEQSFEEILKDVPDEFYKWLTNCIEKLLSEYKCIELVATNDYLSLARYQDTSRKDFAIEATKTKYPQLMFAMLDGKDIKPMIWKLIKPSGDLRFKNIDNE